MKTNRIRTAALGVLVAVGLTGCVRVEADTSIGEDDTFSQHIIVAFNDSVADQVSNQAGIDAGSLSGDLASDAGFSDLQAKYPGQVELKDYSDEDLNGFELTLTDLPLSEFNGAAGDVTAGLGASASIEHIENAFVVSMSSDPDALLDSTSDAGPLGSLGTLELSASNLGFIESSIEFAVTYTFPGLVSEATAGKIDGNTVTLGLSDLTAGGDIKIVGGDSKQIDWWPYIKWALIIAAFASVIGAASLLIRQDQRRRSTNTLAPPGGGHRRHRRSASKVRPYVGAVYL